ncbi:MAG: glycosyltransferase family 4 protein [Desulfobacter sp.]|nr:MAG: glycosyltransferase family 4 protein [Desulfobacter sp.]
MKVLYFHQHFSTPKGATGTRSYEMAKMLIKKGHSVTMVCGAGFMSETGIRCKPVDGIKRGVVEGIDVIEIDLKYSNYDDLWKRSVIFISFALKSIRIALSEKYDILFATSTPLTAGIPGIAIKLLKPSTRFVFEVRDLWPDLPKAMKVVTNPFILFALKFLEQATYAAMDAGISLSPGIRDGMKKGAGGGKKIGMIPNGSDVELFQPQNERTMGTKLKSYGILDTQLKCVFTGAHGIANGLDAVLDAAAVLKKRARRDISIIFIGDGKLKSVLKNRALEEELDNCIFIDPIPKYHLAKVLQQADVGMMILDDVPAFYYGTSPNKFFDYIASGLPVLNNYPGWLKDIITKHQCGVAVPPGDPDAFADALVELAENPEKRMLMGINSRKLALSRFNRRILAHQFVRFIEDTKK